MLYIIIVTYYIIIYILYSNIQHITYYNTMLTSDDIMMSAMERRYNYQLQWFGVGLMTSSRQLTLSSQCPWPDVM